MRCLQAEPVTFASYNSYLSRYHYTWDSSHAHQIRGLVVGRPNWPLGLAHFLGLLIEVQNPASTGIPGQEGRVQKPGKEFGPKTAFLDSLDLWHAGSSVAAPHTRAFERGQSFINLL
jgi:hypothetical protein